MMKLRFGDGLIQIKMTNLSDVEIKVDEIGIPM